nr:MAG TPA: hypothetical protein [Caudoviricetes sp.]
MFLVGTVRGTSFPHEVKFSFFLELKKIDTERREYI